MLQITAIHLVGDAQHEHIAELKWVNPDDGASGSSSRAQMVTFTRDQEGTAYVLDGANKNWVGVVDATSPYIRTHADGKWNINLLALPRD